jgi:hypothetical protein
VTVASLILRMQTDGSVRFESDCSAEQLGPLLAMFATDMTRVRAEEFVSFLATAPRGACETGAPHLALTAPGSCRPALTICGAAVRSMPSGAPSTSSGTSSRTRA